MTGLWIEAYGAATRELSADPLFELGNHSYSHGAFHSPCYHLFPIPESKAGCRGANTDDLLTKIRIVAREILSVTFGDARSDAQAIKTVKDQGYTIVGGDVDGGDGFEKYAKPIVSNVQRTPPSRQHSALALHMHGARMRQKPRRHSRRSSKSCVPRVTASSKLSDLLKFPPGEPVKPPAMPREVDRFLRRYVVLFLVSFPAIISQQIARLFRVTDHGFKRRLHSSVVTFPIRVGKLGHARLQSMLGKCVTEHLASPAGVSSA